MIGVLSSVLPFIIAIVAFGVIIFVHELGHFTAAKLFGVKINEFAMGMGPAIFKFKKGETNYAVRLFPIGGFVSMEGEDEESHDPRSFQSKPIWQRVIILIAGASMNLILGFILALTLTNLQSGSLASTTISHFGDTAISNSKLQLNDEIIKINGEKVNIDMDIIFSLSRISDGYADFEIKRDGKKLLLEDVPFDVIKDEETGYESLAIDFKVYPKDKTIGSVLHQSFFHTLATGKTVWVSLLEIGKGKYGVKDLSGPIAVTTTLATAYKVDIKQFLAFVCMITVNVGIFNVLPFPALDGGRVIFLLIEKLRGKPVNPKYEAYINGAGLLFLMLLMLVVGAGDIGKLIS